MSLTLVATFNTKEEATRAVTALSENGWNNKTVSTTVRRELGSRPAMTNCPAQSESFKAVVMVAIIGAAIGAGIGLMLALDTLGISVSRFQQNPLLGLIAGAVVGLAVGTYSGAVASVRKNKAQGLEQLSPYLSAKERVMVSISVPDERQDAVSKLFRKYGAYAVREWSLLSAESPRGVHA